MFTISKISTTKDVEDAIVLMRAYCASLGIDLAFQGIDEELKTFPSKYTPPSGALLLARIETGRAIGCVALRALDKPGVCEMKRLYVDTKGRGLGVGKALAEAIIFEAKSLGYQTMVLDTLSTMNAAKRLYSLLGFTEIPAYYQTPIEGTVFLELPLK